MLDIFHPDKIEMSRAKKGLEDHGVAYVLLIQQKEDTEIHA